MMTTEKNETATEKRELRTLFPFNEELLDTAEKRLRVVETKSPSQRQYMIEHLLFRYPKFDEITKGILEFHRPVEEGHAQTMYVGGLVGQPRSGKTTIINAFRQLPENMPQTQADGTLQHPVAYIQGRANMNNFAFVEDIFEATEASSTPRMNRGSVKRLGSWRILMSGVKLLIVEDAHYFFRGRRETMENVIDILTDLLNKRLCNILLIGLPSIDDGMEDFIQFHGRGHFPCQRVEKYNKESRLDQLEYLGFLKGVAMRMPFIDETRFATEELFPHFVEATGGLKGHTMDIIVDAAVFALNDKSRCVTGSHLYRACFKRAKPGQKSIPFAPFKAAA